MGAPALALPAAIIQPSLIRSSLIQPSLIRIQTSLIHILMLQALAAWIMIRRVFQLSLIWPSSVPSSQASLILSAITDLASHD